MLLSPTMAFRFVPVMFFSGVQQTFCYAVLPTSVGNSMNLRNHDSALGTSSLILGLGSILGSVVTSFSRKSSVPLNVVMLSFFTITVVCYYLTYLAFPYDSPTSRIGTWKTSFIGPNLPLILVLSFILGVSDGLYQTQGCDKKHNKPSSVHLVMAFIGIVYKDGDEATLGYALFQFVHSFASSLMFFVGSFIPMPYQMAMLTLKLLTFTYPISYGP